MALKELLIVATVLTIALTVEVVDESKLGNEEYDIDVSEAIASSETRNGSAPYPDYPRLQFSIKVTIVNNGSTTTKVQQRFLFPDGVDVKSFTLENDGYRAKRSADNQRLTQWVGGMVNLKPSESKEADLTYVNHPAQVLNPNSKTFHRLATAIFIKDDGIVAGEIFSPNYLRAYPNGADLTWLIAYPSGNTVKLKMINYATEECCDRLMVYDGRNTSHSPLASFEGYYYPGSNNIVYSTQPAMFLRFTSDCLVTNRGFHASYINQPNVSPPPMSCGNVRLTSGNSGYIESPNYPVTYDELMNCTWPVQTYYNTRVKFVLYNISIGFDDYVAFYDGTPSNPGSFIMGISGASYYDGYTIYASSYRAFVVFLSGTTSYDYNMFYITYSGEYVPEPTTAAPATCGSVSPTGSYSGYIYSPNYPSSYPPNVNCTWSVNTSYGTVVVFSVQTFNLPYGDYLYVYDGTPQHGSLVKAMTGSYSSGYEVTTNSNEAFLLFSSDPHTYSSYYKFQFYYYGKTRATTRAPQEETTAVYYDPSPCYNASQYESGSGYIMSPGYYSPGYYPLDEGCTWYITAYTYYSAVRFYPTFFSTEYGYDWVKIYIGHGTASSNLIAQISGYVDPYTTLAIINSRYATMTFTSDVIISDHGFRIYFYGIYYYDAATTASPVEATTVHSTERCYDQYYYGYSGFINSPNYPSNYFDNMNCTSWIYTPYGTMVELTVESFNLNSGDCVYLYNANNGQYLNTLYGYYSYGTSWREQTNYIRLQFVSNSYSTSTGYQFRYDAVSDYNYYTTASPSTCGGEMPYNSGVITSPNYQYGYDYSNNLNCIWTVTVSSNKYVLFTVNYFQTESCCDYVIFYEGTPTNTTGYVKRMQGNVSSGTEVVVSDYQAYVTFHTDPSVTENGFSISYSAVSEYYVSESSNVTASYDSGTQPTYTSWIRSGLKDNEVGGPRILGEDLWEGAKKQTRTSATKIRAHLD